jgi:CDP-glucose 4,6-dehydratase
MSLEKAESRLKGSKVLITGHTGFTGTWVQLWLDEVGAECIGLSFENQDEYSMRKSTKLKPTTEFIGDVADSAFVLNTFAEVKPDFVLHLAAQPIVSVAYADPLRTVLSNTQGTAVVLEACRKTDSVQSIVCVTTDKVYKNLENGIRFTESDELGGKDPYSASKSAAEHVISAYRRVLEHEKRKINLQVARGGNIVGGGDYSKDRIIPDLVRSIINDEIISIRQPNSTRPWQHVLSLIHGYILLLAKDDAEEPFGTWNFGPMTEKEMKVSEIIRLFESHWKSPKLKYDLGNFDESTNLNIDSSNAVANLGWSPQWDYEKIFSETIDWYKNVHTSNVDALAVSRMQLNEYRKLHSQ